jgi:flagellar biosynthesis anti-sigma factor FlgM
MEIRKTGIAQGPEITKLEPAGSLSKRGGETVPVQGDAVTLSGGAQEVARLSAAANELPDVRDEKVEAMQNALGSGTYSVEGSKVAEKLLREVIVDTKV